MQLGFGSTNVGLQDGSSSWNAPAADTLDIWNGYLDFISITLVASSGVPQVSGDGINSVFFSNAVFGDSFGDLALAMTVYLTADSDTKITEADVIVNNADNYDSYRGFVRGRPWATSFLTRIWPRSPSSMTAFFRRATPISRDSEASSRAIRLRKSLFCQRLEEAEEKSGRNETDRRGCGALFRRSTVGLSEFR